MKLKTYQTLLIAFLTLIFSETYATALACQKRATQAEIYQQEINALKALRGSNSRDLSELHGERLENFLSTIAAGGVAGSLGGTIGVAAGLLGGVIVAVVADVKYAFEVEKQVKTTRERLDRKIYLLEQAHYYSQFKSLPGTVCVGEMKQTGERSQVVAPRVLASSLVQANRGRGRVKNLADLAM